MSVGGLSSPDLSCLGPSEAALRYEETEQHHHRGQGDHLQVFLSVKSQSLLKRAL